MGNPMMTDKNPNDVKEWSPEHVKKHLEEHITSSKYDNNDIKKIWDQDVDGYTFLRLTEEKLTNTNGLFKIKLEHASHIMKLVERLKEKQG